MYNLEYEYWIQAQSKPKGYYCETYLKTGNLTCDREGSFKYYINSLEIMRLLADDLDHDIKVEAYIGNFNEKEAIKISQKVDRLLIADYVKTEDRLFPYVKERLKLLEKINSKIKVCILYSEESRFLGQYLKGQSFKDAEKKFFDELEVSDFDIEEHVNLVGFSYYNYGYFKYFERDKKKLLNYERLFT